MNVVDVTIESHVDEALRSLEDAKKIALEMVGQKAEGYVFALTPKDTGRLQNSITHMVKAADDEVHIGTNVEYAPYVELGTGIYAEDGNGRQTPWRYQDEKGVWHTTRGSKPQPFLRPGITRHLDEYKRIIHDVLDSTGDF